MKKLILFATIIFTTLLSHSKDPANALSTNNRAPLAFIENKGQVTDQNRQPRNDVQFSLKAAPGLNIFIGNGAIHYQFSRPDSASVVGKAKKHPNLQAARSKSRGEFEQPLTYNMYRMDVKLMGANINAEVIREQKQDYYENYFNERTNGNTVTANTYNKITYKNIYPNIDWVLYVKDGQLEHEFVIHAGGNAADIQLKYGGAAGLKINADGSLIATTPQGTVTEQAPKSYQPDGTPVKSAFKLSDDVLSYETGGVIGELVIDPTLQWATYYGGSGYNIGYGTATDYLGNVFIDGSTTSAANIATSGAYQTIWGGNANYDAYLAMFNSAGAIQWATYYGGPASDLGARIATDRAGYVYMTGSTQSSSGIATAGAYQTSLDTIGGAAFLAKFSNAGALIWATYFGGNQGEVEGGTNGAGLATDTSDNIYLTGQTEDSTGIATPGAYQTTFVGWSGSFGTGDGFLAKFNNSGALQWSTYFGGIDISHGTNCISVATDASANVFITGETFSLSGIASMGAYQTIGDTMGEAFLAKFSSAGTRQWSTYYGGINNNGITSGKGIAVDNSGNLYITGVTISTVGIATVGAYQTTFGNGTYDGFLAKFNTAGTRQWGTYYGGNGGTFGIDVAIGNSGYIYFAGYTNSTTGIATPGAYQTTITANGDAYLAEFDTTGNRTWSSYFGGTGGTSGTEAQGIASDALGNAYITGDTYCTSGIATVGAYQTNLYGTSSDAFLAKFSFCTAAPTVSPITGPTTLCALGNITLTDSIAGGVWASNNTSLATVNGSGIVSGVAAGLDTITYSVTNSCGTTAVNYPVTVNALPTVNAVSNQSVCAGATVSAINFTGSTVPGTVYNWTCSNTSIGLAASGTGSIASFTGLNTGSVPVTATITATPVSPQGYAYIANYNSNNISVINTSTNLVVDTIHVATSPWGISLSPDGSKVYISDYNSNSLSVISTATNSVVATVNGLGGPYGVAVSPDGNKVYVANSDLNNVSVINTTTNTISATINVGSGPLGLAVTPDGNKVYVANGDVSGTDSVSVINTSNNTVIANIYVGTGPYGLAVSPDNSTVYVTNSESHSVSVINNSTNTVAYTINVGNAPSGVAISPDGSKVYVTNNRSNNISVINSVTHTVVDSISVGSYPNGISLTPDGSQAYVVNSNSNSISVINTFTNTVVDTILVGSVPVSVGNFITAGSGCTGNAETFTITVNPKPTASVTGTATGCGQVSLTATGGTTGYAWSGGNSPNTAANTFSSSNTYTVTVTGAGSCTATASTAVTVNTIPTAGITGIATGCGSVSLTATGGGTYAWSGGNSTNTAANTFSSSNTYTVTVTGTGSCTATASQVVMVNAIPTAGITGTATGCGQVSLTATGGTGYAWSGGNSTNTAANTFSSSNTYAVTVTVAGGCSATASRIVTVDTIPTAGITGTATACGSVSLTATGGTGYAWSGGSSPNTAANTFISSNTYTVTVSNSFACSATASQAVSVATVPNVTITPNGATTFCNGDSVILTAATANGYTWSNTATTQSITVKQAGNYTVIVSSAAGCSATSTATVVTVNSLPVAAINGPTTICSGLSATLTASGGTSYNWSGGLGTNAQITVSPVSTTPYTVTVTNANNCSATATQTVSVTSTPTASITGATQVCNGSSVMLTANGGNTYTWANSLGSNAAITVSPTVNTTYTVTATIGVNCSATASQTVTVNQPAASQFSHAVCAGQTYNFNNNSLTQSGSYNDTLQTINGCDSIVTLHLTVNSIIQTSLTDTACEGHAVIFNGQSLTQQGVYKDTLQSAAGCDSLVTLSLFINSATVPTITRSNDTLQTQTYSSYQWLLNGLAAPNGTNQDLVVTQNGNYSVVVTNANGCTDTSSTISVTDVGIKDIATGYTVQLYPNPNNGNFTLQFSDNVTRSVSITDVTGRVVVGAQQVAIHKEFDCSALAGGVYLLQINENAGVRNLRFVVAK